MNDGPIFRALRAPRTTPPAAGGFQRAYEIYRRRVARCRTVNQQNRVHIVIENYMTPAELRKFAAAVSADPADSIGGRWFTRLIAKMPTKKVRPVEFERRSALKGVTLYTGGDGSPERKTLIVGFAGNFNRMMAPMPVFLDCLNPAHYDVLILRDFQRAFFAKGVPGLGNDFFEALSNLRSLFEPNRYRNAIALGTSSGGLPAVLGAIELQLDRGVSIGAVDFNHFVVRLNSHGVDEKPYAALLASRPQPYPKLILAYGGEYKIDVAASAAVNGLVPSELMGVENCATHSVFAWNLERGTLPVFLSKALGQDVEHASAAQFLPSSTVQNA